MIESHSLVLNEQYETKSLSGTASEGGTRV